MSLFGKLDAQQIPTNPYYVEAGEYTAEVTDAAIKENSNGGKQLQIEYTITSEDSAFVKSKVKQFFSLVDPDLTQEALLLMPAEEQKKIRQSITSLKRTLCGNDSNSYQKGLGVDVDELNADTWDPKSLIGTAVNMAISNYGANSEGVNIRFVNIITE